MILDDKLKKTTAKEPEPLEIKVAIGAVVVIVLLLAIVVGAYCFFDWYYQPKPLSKCDRKQERKLERRKKIKNINGQKIL